MSDTATSLGGLESPWLTAEPRYRDWVLEYTGAWRDRIVQNKGNVPTNIGLDGTIGGEWNGKWSGGTFGWNFDSTSMSPRSSTRSKMARFGDAREPESTEVTVDGKSQPINATHFTARLANGSGARLRITMRRDVNQPTLAFPWDR